MVYKCTICGEAPTVTVRSRLHEGPGITISHCGQYITDVVSYWGSDTTMPFRTGCKQVIIETPPKASYGYLYFSDREAPPISEESVEFCNKYFIQAAPKVRIVNEQQYLTVPLINSRPIDGYNTMVYRASVFYNYISQYRTEDIEAFARRLENFHHHQIGVDLFLKNSELDTPAHRYAAANCTGPCDYYDRWTNYNRRDSSGATS